MKTPKIPFTCVICGLASPIGRRGQLTCSEACRRVRATGAYVAETTSRLPTAVTGAMHEHLVCYDLLRRGFPTFRACSPSCLCDLILIDGRSFARVEVRTGIITPLGEVSFPFAPKDIDKQDIIAVVTGVGVIHYFKVTDLCPERLSVTPPRTVKHRNKKQPSTGMARTA